VVNRAFPLPKRRPSDEPATSGGDSAAVSRKFGGSHRFYWDYEGAGWATLASASSTARGVSEADLSEEGREKLRAMPDPDPPVPFPEAIRTRKQAGGHAEASHRCATL